MGEKIEFVYPCRDCTTQEHCIKASLSNNEFIKCIHFGYIEDLCNAVRLSVERKVANDILKTINEVCFGKEYRDFRIDYGSNGQRDFIIDFIKDNYGVE